MTADCTIGPVSIGPGRPLAVIAGPCVLEAPETNRQIARVLRDACADLGLPFVFKASFDKANRSSIDSPRGPGLAAGLEELRRIGAELDVPLTTDVHDPAQAEPAAAVVDLLQVPAFLVRQTDLLVACARTGRPVNAKKSQMMAPREMRHVVGKLRDAGCADVLLTERGTFFGYHRLVTDFVGLGDLMEIGPPVCFDVTHSTQLPGGGESTTGGRADRGPLLARAAVAAGVDAVFIECHPDPPAAFSDASTVQPLAEIPGLLADLAAIRRAVKGADPATDAGPRTSASLPLDRR